MSMPPNAIPAIPEATIRVARAAFPRADLMSLRISKEGALFSPGPAQQEQRKAVAAEGMERMRNGKGVLSIRATGCS